MPMSAIGTVLMKSETSNHSITIPWNLFATLTCVSMLTHIVTNSRLVVLFVTKVLFVMMLMVMKASKRHWLTL